MTMPIPDGSAVTTPGQMLGKIDATIRGLDSLTGEVRAMRGEINPAFADLRSDVADHETTLRAVVRDVTVVKTQLRAAWAFLGVLFIALGVVAGFLSAMHGCGGN